MFRKKKPDLKEATTKDLLAELAIRFDQTDINIDGVRLDQLFKGIPTFVNGWFLNKTRSQ